MSEDKMLDAFPIAFDFKQGESPDEEKLTGLVKHVNIAFDDVTEVIGDPWDIQNHSWGSASHKLSLERLGQANLARLIGPSDWIGPIAGDFSEASSIAMDLKPYKNSWILGYPLVKVDSTIGQKSTAANLSPLVWGTDITVTRDIDNILVNRKTNIKNVDTDGDFYVDFYKGVIFSYKPTTSYIRLSITNLHSLGAGVPWGTHNVIPAWEENSALCNLTEIASSESSTLYNLSLPQVEEVPRVSYVGKEIAGGSYSNWSPDSQWYYNPGQNTNYNLPQSITSSMSSGDEVPEGFVLIWDDNLGRILPGITSIQYIDESTLRITAPLGYLDEGTNYRIITVGTSLAEAVSYLLTSQRYDSHTGIQHSAKLGYSIPISHSDLENRYTDKRIRANSEYTLTSFKFRESDYPTNCHPQYLHRYGYMEDDIEGNTANAMRGNLVFSGALNDDSYLIGNTKTTSGNYRRTYGLIFGNGKTGSEGGSRLYFSGGEGMTNWADGGSTGPAKRLGFGLQEVGAVPCNSRSDETYGALTINPWYGTPLYIRGPYSTPSGADDYVGGVLAFDLGKNAEMNYLKLFAGYRSGSYDVNHLLANIDQNNILDNPLAPTSNVWAAEQTRELRFRGVSYNPTSTSPTAIGDLAIRSDDVAIPEFDKYYTSPGILGADFINVYSNAVFFSDVGNGTVTSFTTNGKDWLDNNPTDPLTSFYTSGQMNQYMPTGMYYHPSGTDIGQRFVFSLYDSGLSGFSQPLNFGDRSGFEYVSNLGGNVRLSTRPETGETLIGGGILLAAGTTSKEAIDAALVANPSTYKNSIRFAASNFISIGATNTLFLACSDIQVTGDTTFNSDVIFDDEDIIFSNNADINITGSCSITSSEDLYLASPTAVLGLSDSNQAYFRSTAGIELSTTGSSSTSYISIQDSGDIRIYGTSGDLILSTSGNDIILNVTGGNLKLYFDGTPASQGNVKIGPSDGIVVVEYL